MTLQEQARALGDPTRHGVFRYLADADRPVDVAELTDHFGLNHNAIRQHLAKLVAAGLVVETTAEASGRGRPRLRYAVAPAVDSRWGVEGPYERLARWLAEVVRTGDTPVEVGRRVGRGQRIGGAAGEPVGVLVDHMARQGFAPAVVHDGDDLDVVLTQCPFASTASADPATVCQLHFGLAQGVAEGLEGIEITELVPNDPHRAHCHLRVHLDPAG
jgi:predicted ArsR family transcriptional regulator